MYKYKVTMYTGLRGSENRKMHSVSIAESALLLTNEEVRLKVLEEMISYPRTHHCEIELLQDETDSIIADIDRLMMAISVRKTEISDKYTCNKLGKPNFNDLDWCFEQLYYLKKQYADNQ